MLEMYINSVTNKVNKLAVNGWMFYYDYIRRDFVSANMCRSVRFFIFFVSLSLSLFFSWYLVFRNSVWLHTLRTMQTNAMRPNKRRLNFQRIEHFSVEMLHRVPLFLSLFLSMASNRYSLTIKFDEHTRTLHNNVKSFNHRKLRVSVHNWENFSNISLLSSSIFFFFVSNPNRVRASERTYFIIYGSNLFHSVHDE